MKWSIVGAHGAEVYSECTHLKLLQQRTIVQSYNLHAKSVTRLKVNNIWNFWLIDNNISDQQTL